jgi:hypothetical protein
MTAEIGTMKALSRSTLRVLAGDQPSKASPKCRDAHAFRR